MIFLLVMNAILSSISFYFTVALIATKVVHPEWEKFIELTMIILLVVNCLSVITSVVTMGIFLY